MKWTPLLDRLLADAEAAAAKQPNQNATEHIVVALFRNAKANPARAEDLERTIFAKCVLNYPATKADRTKGD